MGQRTPFKKLKGSTLVGVEIGSSAVRAAEVSIDRARPTLRRFAEVTLPPGAVADGEIADPAAVSASLRQLWKKGHFSSRRVVIGISSQRVIVRLADLPAMTESDLRSALKFEAQDLIPIPTDQALLDFTILQPLLPAPEGTPPQMRIMLAAAHRDMVGPHLAALKGARLQPVAVDVAALAMLRIIPLVNDTPESGGVDAVVSIGADLTTVAVRERGIARFVRILNVGGGYVGGATVAADASIAGFGAALAGGAAGDGGDHLANGHSPVAVAERAPGIAPERMSRLVDDIQSSLDFYLAQAGAERIDRVVVAGSAARIDGVIDGLAARLSAPVALVDPSLSLAIGRPGVSEERFAEVAPTLVTSVGLSLWGAGKDRKISLLPDEIGRAQSGRQWRAAGILAAVAAACVFAAAWSARTTKIDHVRHQVESANALVATQRGQLAGLSGVTKPQAALAARQQLYVGALGKDIDWIRLVQQIYATDPNDVTIQTLALTGVGATAAVASTTATGDGTLSMALLSSGGPTAVANWLRAMQTNPALQDVWVSGLTKGAGAQVGTVSFSSTATVTDAALSRRTVAASKGSP